VFTADLRVSSSCVTNRDFAPARRQGIVAAGEGMFAVHDRSERMVDAAEIAAINAKHLANTPLKPADLLFVFGTRIDEALRAETACRLWREGLFRTAIVSGGVTAGSLISECAIIKPLMVQGGVPPERILEEHQATNTGENVIFSLPIIEAALGLKNVSTVICLGNTWTGRRYAMTLQRHWPEVEKMLITVDDFATPREQWHTDPEFRRRVLAEWDKIEPYKATGFVAEWPVARKAIHSTESS
jgi:DUF218 domain-containing protein